MIPIAPTRVYDLGKYTIRAQPLTLNPYWTTHLIFLRGKLIGRQLSVPSLSDCRWFEVRGGVYATEEESHKLPVWSEGSYAITRRGRPSKKEQARRAAMEPPVFQEFTV